MGAFMVVVLKMSAETVWEEYFHPYHSQIIAFRDASYGDCTYECTVRAIFLKLVDLSLPKGT
jgi:hypothetical protein